MFSYSIKNIKSFKESSEVELKPLTIFVGKNSCGKSSLIRFPVVLKQTIMSNSDSPLVMCGNLLDYGNYEDVIFGRKRGSIEFGIAYEFDSSQNPYLSRYRLRQNWNKKKFMIPQIDKVAINVRIGRSNKRIKIENVDVLVDGIILASFYKVRAKQKIMLRKVINDGAFVEYAQEYDSNNAFFRNYFPIFYFDEIAINILQKLYPSKDIYPKDVPQLLSTLMEADDEINISLEEVKVRNELWTLSVLEMITDYIFNSQLNESESTAYIGPFRESPARVYRDSELQSQSVGVHGENVSTILIRDLQKKNELINKVSAWLNRTMGYSLGLKDMGSGFFQVMLIDKSKNTANIMDVGYGISQVLPIVIQILRDNNDVIRYRYGNSSSKRYTIIEQPELHLHPAAQAELADLFVSAIDDDRNVIVETHSEHFIRKLQVLIADKTVNFTNEMVKIYYVDKDQEGIASVHEIPVGEDGRFLEKWPSGFFDKAHELSMDLLHKIEE